MFEQAEEICRRGLAANPDGLDLIDALAKIYMGQRRWPEAIAQYEKALALAGGLSPRAARGKIEVKRADSDSFGRVDMDDPVFAGDVINVPQSFF